MRTCRTEADVPATSRKTAASAEARQYAPARRAARRWFTLIVILLSLWIMRSFLIPLAWATVLAVTAWPLYMRASAGTRQTTWLIPLAFTLAVGVIPVSYPHLDVYKRQAIHLEASNDRAPGARPLPDREAIGIPICGP